MEKHHSTGSLQVGWLTILIDSVRHNLSGNMKKPDLKGFRVLVWFLIAATMLPQFTVAEWTIIVWFSPFFWIMICAFYGILQLGKGSSKHECQMQISLCKTLRNGQDSLVRRAFRTEDRDIGRHHSSSGFKSPCCIEARALWGAVVGDQECPPSMVTRVILVTSDQHSSRRTWAMSNP